MSSKKPGDVKTTKPAPKKGGPQSNKKTAVTLFILDAFLLVTAVVVFIMKPSCEANGKEDFFGQGEADWSQNYGTVGLQSYASPPFNQFQPQNSFSSQYYNPYGTPSYGSSSSSTFGSSPSYYTLPSSSYYSPTYGSTSGSSSSPYYTPPYTSPSYSSPSYYTPPSYGSSGSTFGSSSSSPYGFGTSTSTSTSSVFGSSTPYGSTSYWPGSSTSSTSPYSPYSPPLTVPGGSTSSSSTYGYGPTSYWQGTSPSTSSSTSPHSPYVPPSYTPGGTTSSSWSSSTSPYSPYGPPTYVPGGSTSPYSPYGPPTNVPGGSTSPYSPYGPPSYVPGGSTSPYSPYGPLTYVPGGSTSPYSPYGPPSYVPGGSASYSPTYGSFGSVTDYGTPTSGSISSVSGVSGFPPVPPSYQPYGPTFEVSGHQPSPPSSISSFYASAKGFPDAADVDLTLIPEDKYRNTNFECGNTPIKPNLKGGRIIGGYEAVPNSWPWLVHYSYRNKDQKYGVYGSFCGGAIVTPRHVVTAHHCYYEDADHVVLIGKHDLNNLGKAIKVVKARTHPYGSFKSGTLYTFEVYDLALLTLAEEITFNDKVQPVCLPKLEVVPPEGKTCWTQGWGQTNDPKSEERIELKQVPLKVLHEAGCVALNSKLNPAVKRLEFFIKKEYNICGSGGKGQDTCTGDSGGPYTCNENGKWVLYGATSWGFECGSGTPGQYAAVSYSMSWYCCFLKDLPACQDIQCDIERIYKPPPVSG